MPRNPKPENRDNPLRKLRGLLSQKGYDSPITQDELRRMTDIPLPTIRAIEAGQRLLRPAVLRKIYLATHLRWNPTHELWALEGKRPLTNSEWQLFKEYYRSRPPNYERRIKFMHERLDALFQKVLQKDWHLLANRIDDCFEACKDDFKLQGLAAFFRDTSREAADEWYRRNILPGPRAYADTTETP